MFPSLAHRPLYLTGVSYAGTYTDTAIITRSNTKIYGQTNTSESYVGNSTLHRSRSPHASGNCPTCPSIEGLTSRPSRTSTAVTITNDVPASTAGSNDASGTVQVHATGVSLYNLNIANTYGKVGPSPLGAARCSRPRDL